VIGLILLGCIKSSHVSFERLKMPNHLHTDDHLQDPESYTH
jgi:hypothetical protein